jgi:hypothetical protein
MNYTTQTPGPVLNEIQHTLMAATYPAVAHPYSIGPRRMSTMLMVRKVFFDKIRGIPDQA